MGSLVVTGVCEKLQYFQGKFLVTQVKGRRFPLLTGDEGHAPDVLFFSVVPMILCIYKASGVLPISAVLSCARFPKRLKTHQG